MADEKYLLRLPPDLKARLSDLAVIDGRSLNNLIVRVLREWAERQGLRDAKD